MYARVNTFQGPPENADQALKTVREQVIPTVRSIPGNAGIISLVDRATGKSIGITLWNTEEDLRNSEQTAGGVRQQSADDSESRVVSVERFEVTDIVLEGQPATA
jgi:heme-degrading monooxygenase HmoA